jgi:hypothetical protein
LRKACREAIVSKRIEIIKGVGVQSRGLTLSESKRGVDAGKILERKIR